MAQTNNEKSRKLRAKRAVLGLKRKEFWLTENDAIKVIEFIKKLTILKPDV